MHRPIIIHDNDLPLPHRLTSNLGRWSFASPMTQRIIRRGLTWRWIHKPPSLSLPPRSSCRGNLSPHITRLLHEGVLLPVPHQRCYTSHVFLVPKATGGERVIIDLSRLNLHILCPSFKMLDVSKIRNSIPKGAFFTSIDLSDAFHHIPIHPRFQKFLAFSHNNKLYFFQGMPFGLNLGPLIFTKIITEVLKLLHTQKIPASVYLDDFLLWNRSEEQLRNSTNFTTNLLANLGFTVNWRKSHLLPSHTLTYLGINWNGLTYTLSPSIKNITKVISQVTRVLSKKKISKKMYQQILGSINFLAPYTEEGKAHLRRVIISAPKFNRSGKALLRADFRQHLQWWTQEHFLSRPTPISLPAPHLSIWSDPSNSGWEGACSQVHSAWGTWSPAESKNHINVLECLAVTKCLQAIKPPQNTAIMIRSDNTTVVSLINKQGSNKSPRLNALFEETLQLCQRNNWMLRARHIPGHLNSWADSLSRNHIIRAEWILTQRSFKKITKIIKPQIDLFAHPGNAKLPSFGCLFPHPSATVVDAMSTNWNRWTVIYLFPPPDLIQACLQKLQLFEGTGIFVAPHNPAAPWWPAFAERCALLDNELEIFQRVRGKDVSPKEATSLIFRAFSF